MRENSLKTPICGSQHNCREQRLLGTKIKARDPLNSLRGTFAGSGSRGYAAT
jgi:hypothetical protein